MLQPVNNWRSYLPILDVIREYRRDDFHHDLVAGLVVGVITVPQAIAYAFLAGLPPEAGLYACLVPMVIYALLGSSRQLVVGPVAVAALMVAAAVSEYAPAYSDAYLGITTVLCLQAGLFLLLLRLWNMGGLVNLLSLPVIAGFVNAAALLIIISQLGAFTGISGGNPASPLDRLLDLAANIDQLNSTSVIIGVACAGGVWFFQRYAVASMRLIGLNLPAQHPISRIGPVVVAIAAGIAVALGDLDTRFGVAVIGEVPAGLPAFTLPPFNLDLWLDLMPASAMIAVVSYVESYSIGTTLATRKRTRINSNQELIALGAANIGAAFTGAYPVAGSFSRSSVNYQAGGRTPVSSLICSVVIVLTLLFFTPLFDRLPHAALAAIVMLSVLGLMDLKSFRTHWHIYREDTVTQIVTFLTVLGFGVETGLITGVVLSIAFFVRQSSRPHIAIVGRVGDGPHFRTAKRYDVETFQHVAAIRIDENVYFANAAQVENKLLKIVHRRPSTKHVLLVCSAINLVDISGLEMLERINQTLDRMGITLHLSEVKGPVMARLEAARFIINLTGSVFFTTDQAMRDLGERL
ncbi:MAG: sulfate permease [Gammaproteobacteria bacterium]|nr:sulfate permease [Gammaproteobacteria bacterium]